MQRFWVYIFLLNIFFVKGQDLDIYKKDVNSNFKFPAIPTEMTYGEFKILSTNLRMQDIGIAMIFPGHVHFKIGEQKTGYYIAGARVAGYAGLIYMSAKGQSIYKTIFESSASIEVSTGDQIISYGSLLLIGGSFLYDWIHGKYILEEKQNQIRYKYSKKRIKTGFSFIRSNQKLYPGIDFKYTF